MSMENGLLLGRGCCFLSVHDHESGLRALERMAAARDAGGSHTPPVLLSPAGAGAYMGPAWWRALMAGLGAECASGAWPVFPAGWAGSDGLPFAHVLDCGASPVHAVMALRYGQRAVVLEAHGPQAMAARALYRQAEGVVLACRPAIISPY